MHSKQKTRSRKNSPTTKNTKQHNQPVQTNSKPEELTKQSVANLNSVDTTSSKHSESSTQTNQTTSRSLKEVIGVGLKSWQNWLNSLVGEGRELKKYWRIVEQIEALEPTIKKLTDEELKAKTKEFRSQLTGLNDKEVEKKLAELLPEAFAVVREAAVRNHWATSLSRCN
jgi:protein translocase subunit secA